jgi:geranylgeranyl diphosphate synthase type II
MITLKTASLIAGGLAIGAVLGNASEEEVEATYRFGKNCGIAFQLQDDILDTFGDIQKTGKQVGGDIMMNKKTYLLLKAYENADKKEEQRLAALMQEQPEEPATKVKKVRQFFDDLDVRQQAEAAKEEYLQRGFEALDQIKVDASRKAPLKEMAQRLVDRER